ncbi:MAG: mechanosensitive ion channel [candidate division Zixibacteria bacterium]|nr:mechanosensitive ion channel [Gammaproteobacteria bacterium]NIX57382.1 mechanosensitive ion channel [candidate division Zixibacteria bacterium]
MTIEEIKNFIEINPLLAFFSTIILSTLVYFIGRLIVGRGLLYLAKRTETNYDDIVLEHLKPYRVSWIAPLVLIYAFAELIPIYQTVIEKTTLVFILWIAAVTFNSLLNSVNQIYESSPSYNGVAIQSYLDLVKLLVIIIALIITISLVTGESPVVLLTGIGAATAVLLLIFQNTILSIVASVQIAVNDLLKEGDWVEVPSYSADGDVQNISLHTIKIKNFNNTISVIPTNKILDVAYINWRGMQESGGRRIMRSIYIDINSIKFCDSEMLKRLAKIDLIQDYIQDKSSLIETYISEQPVGYDPPLDGPNLTNVEVFRTYIDRFLRTRKDIHQENMTLLVRSLSPSDHGLPIEVYAFTKTTEWEKYEHIQAEIFDHLIAAAHNFDLRLFQQPTGLDFSKLATPHE